MAMSGTQQLIRIKNEYREAYGTTPASARTMLMWAIDTGRYVLDIAKARTQAVAEFANALAAETALDSNGNAIRANLAFETTQGWLWDSWDTISHQHMELNVSHQRRNIYGEIKNVVLNVNAFNELHAHEAPVQFSLNFAADLADDGIPVPSAIEPEPLHAQPHAVLADEFEPPEPSRPSLPRATRMRERRHLSLLADAPAPADRP